MRKQAFAVSVVLMLVIAIAAEPTEASFLSDLLKGAISKALELFRREVMPVDGYSSLRVGESMVVEGGRIGPIKITDYYVYYDGGNITFNWWIPTEVTVKVTVYKVYFGIFATKYATYNDIWWKRERIGDKGWIGAFFIREFDWKRTGTSSIGRAYIAYNLPSQKDLATHSSNMTILENGTILLDLGNYTKELSFDEFENFGNITVKNVTFKHIVGPLYIVKKRGR